MSDIEIRLTNLEKGYDINARKIKLIEQELEIKTVQLDLLRGMIMDVNEICDCGRKTVDRFIFGERGNKVEK